MLTRAALLLAGHAGTALCLLARNLAVAALVSAGDYGVAVTFAMAMALVEMVTQIGVPSQIVRSPRGDDPDWIAGVHGFEILRGALAALLLWLAAGPIAAALDAGEIAWAYRVLALAPLLRGFQHADIHRLMRVSRHGPALLAAFAPAALALIVIIPLAAWVGDWRIMLASLLVQEAVAVVATHRLALRRYRARLDPAVLAELARFGAPILLQGAVLFVAFQADKILVARSLGLEALGIFAMGVTLTLTPALILARAVQTAFLPVLSRSGEGEPGAFGAAGQAAVEAGIVGGVAIAAGTAILLGPAILPVLGPSFAPLSEFLVLLGVQQAFRVFRSGATTVALAAGRPAVALRADALRALGIVPAGAALWLGADLTAVVVTGALFEAAACLVAFRAVGSGMSLRPLVLCVAVGAGSILAVGGGAGAVVAVALLAATICCAPGLRRGLRPAAGVRPA